jgi:hypothetical protein
VMSRGDKERGVVDSEIMESINVIQLKPCEIMWKRHICGRDICIEEISVSKSQARQ